MSWHYVQRTIWSDAYSSLFGLVWDGSARTITQMMAGLKLSSVCLYLVKCTHRETHIIFSSALSGKWRLHVGLRITYCDVLRCCILFPSGYMLGVFTALKEDIVSLVSTAAFTIPTNNQLAHFSFSNKDLILNSNLTIIILSHQHSAYTWTISFVNAVLWVWTL